MFNERQKEGSGSRNQGSQHQWKKINKKKTPREVQDSLGAEVDKNLSLAGRQINRIAKNSKKLRLAKKTRQIVWTS